MMKCKFVSLSGCIQMELRCCLQGCRNGKSASLGWPPVWCLPQRLRYQSQYEEILWEKIMQCNRARNISQCVSIPSVGNVRALYMLPWILAVVVGIMVLMPSLAMPPT